MFIDCHTLVSVTGLIEILSDATNARHPPFTHIPVSPFAPTPKPYLINSASLVCRSLANSRRCLNAERSSLFRPEKRSVSSHTHFLTIFRPIFWFIHLATHSELLQKSESPTPLFITLSTHYRSEFYFSRIPGVFLFLLPDNHFPFFCTSHIPSILLHTSKLPLPQKPFPPIHRQRPVVTFTNDFRCRGSSRATLLKATKSSNGYQEVIS